ncbi:MAG: hypothetical protein U5Q03_05955 [Bacteroidota bacterium]|nr:hypothetical protein [Bacteroidota bacterium]
MNKKARLFLWAVLLTGSQAIPQSLQRSFAKTQMMPPHELIRHHMKISHIPGLSVCCIALDTVIWHHNYGYANLYDSMAHNSGIKDHGLENHIVPGDPSESLASFLENYLDPDGTYYDGGNYSNYQGGSIYNYSNFGTGLNAFLVETLSGTGFYQYVKDSLFPHLKCTVVVVFFPT